MMGSRSRENGGISTALSSMSKNVTQSFVVRAFSRDKDSGPRSSKMKKHVTMQSESSLDLPVAAEKLAVDTKAKSESIYTDAELAQDAGGEEIHHPMVNGCLHTLYLIYLNCVHRMADLFQLRLLESRILWLQKLITVQGR